MKTKQLFKSFSIIFILVMLLSVCLPISANSPVKVNINTEAVDFDVEPMLINGRTMVPMRAIFEKLGWAVLWDDETNTATAYKSATEYISITIGASFMDTFSGPVPLDVPALIVNNRTLVPLRAVSESFKYIVNWDDNTYTVNIYSNDFFDNTKHPYYDVLVMGTSADFPPYEYIENGTFKGIDIEIATAIAQELGAELKITDMPFDAIISSVQKGEVDFGMAAMTVTEERRFCVDFTSSYITNTQVVIIPENSDIVSLDDLYGKKIGTQFGTTGDIYAKDDFGKENITSYNNASDAIIALKNGFVDAVIIDSEIAEAFASQNEGLKIYEFEYSFEDYAILVKKGNIELLNRINAAIEKLTANGTIDTIVAKYISFE